jgi:hypothetical protein
MPLRAEGRFLQRLESRSEASGESEGAYNQGYKRVRRPLTRNRNTVFREVLPDGEATVQLRGRVPEKSLASTLFQSV